MRKGAVHTKKGVKRRKSKEEYVSFTKFLTIVSRRKQDVFTAPSPEKPEQKRAGKYVTFKALVAKIKKNKIARERWSRKIRKRPVANGIKRTIKRKFHTRKIKHTKKH
ncbi:hypothetical protein COV17_02775 [Candidatus Woesearchaeota archaeon CG10_big_fil_rev_8_21_14_0_10_36_11]|nr:MAG: hypothetical protein COV17_02775 [Candidatus Woesearchaeota archaeon CG10_big_fil_rev_8_21_14_0_10_36_11]